MSKKVIFISSLAHSGSTVLGLALGAHEKVVPLGEVWSLLESPQLQSQSDTLRCSCGETMSSCSFWGPICRQLRIRSAKMPNVEKYKLVLDAFFEYFGEDVFFLDSSKNPFALNLLRQVAGLDIRVLSMIRDVRAWTVSIRDVRKRQGEFYFRDLVRKFGPAGILRLPKKFASSCFWFWF